MAGRRVAALLLLCAALVGCSASRRIERIADRHGLTRAAVLTVRDTVAIPEKDTVYIAAIDRDGIFSMHDTEARIKVSGMVDGDSVILCVHRYTDTVVVERHIPYKQIVTEAKPARVTLAMVAIMLWVAGFLAAVFVKLDRKLRD